MSVKPQHCNAFTDSAYVCNGWKADVSVATNDSVRAVLSIALVVAIGACGSANQPQQQAIKAADAYRAERGFAWAGDNRRVAVRDDGKHWAVVYHAPEGAAGGDFIVFVDKQSRRAVDHVAWQ